MGTSYRNSNRRQNRTVEHDIFEGLPVRHWRKEFISIAPPPTHESATSRNDIWDVELPYGMPKDSHLLPQHSQDLLRAARSGKIYGKRPAPVEEEEVDPEVVLGDKPDKKEDEQKNLGYTVKTWKLIPRHLEGTDVDYLAPRRKNLRTITSKPVPTGATLTKATVKRTDATGAEYMQEVVVSTGQQIEGEVVSQTTIPDPTAQPIDPYAVQTPPKKKGPVIRKKAKGPGRGRKKKQVAPTSVPAAAPVDGAPAPESAEGTIGPEGVKTEPGDESTHANGEDVEMADNSAAASDDDESDDAEDGEEGDEGEESASASESPSKPAQTASPVPESLPTMKDIPDLNPALAPLPELEAAILPPLAAHLEKDMSEAKSGSPLKNVALAATSPLTSPVATNAPPFPDSASAPTESIPIESVEAPSMELKSIDTVMQDQVVETAPTELPLPPPEPTVVEEVAAAEVRKEEEEEEEMLLDIVENAENAQIGAEAPAPAPISDPIPEPAPAAEPEIPASAPIENIEPVQEEEPKVKDEPEPDTLLEPQTEDVAPLLQPLEVEAVVEEKEAKDEVLPPPIAEVPEVPEAPAPAPATEEQAPIPAPEPVPEPEAAPAPTPAPAEEEDDMPDLLGGLEKSLNKPAEAPAAEEEKPPQEEKHEEVK